MTSSSNPAASLGDLWWLHGTWVITCQLFNLWSRPCIRCPFFTCWSLFVIRSLHTNHSSSHLCDFVEISPSISNVTLKFLQLFIQAVLCFNSSLSEHLDSYWTHYTDFFPSEYHLFLNMHSEFQNLTICNIPGTVHQGHKFWSQCFIISQLSNGFMLLFSPQ